jgi:hypothetical protein
VVRLASRSKRFEDIRDAARVVSYVFEKRNRHDQIVFTANRILDGLNDESIVHVMTPRFILDIHPHIAVAVVLRQEGPIDSTDLEHISGLFRKIGGDSLLQFALVGREAEEPGKPPLERPAHRSIRGHETARS